MAEKEGRATQAELLKHLSGLASLYIEQGEYMKAELLLHRALSLLEERPSKNASSIVKILNIFARMYLESGESAASQRAATRAIGLGRNVFEPNHPEIATSLHWLGTLLRRTWRREEAEAPLKRALAIREEVFGKDHPLVARTLNELAELERANGQQARADELARRALRITEAAQGAEHHRTSEPLATLAAIALDLGDTRRAISMAEHALAAAERAYGREAFTITPLLELVAEVRAANGDINASLSASKRALDLEDHRALSTLELDPEQRKQALIERLQSSTYRMASLHARRAPRSEIASSLATTTVLRRKGLLLDAMAGALAAIRIRPTHNDRALLRWLITVRARIAAQRSDASRESSAEEIAALEEDQRRLEEELSRRGAEIQAEEEPITIDKIQHTLSKGSALLELLLYKPDLKGVNARAEGWDRPRYLAYIVKHEGSVRWIDLGDAETINTAVEGLRRALSRPATDPTTAARALDALIMQPVRERLGDARRIFVSPDGPLNLVPFNALIDEQGKYLIEDYSFTYLTSGRDLIRFAAPAFPQEGVMILADPEFGPLGGSGELGSGDRGVRSADMRELVFHQLPGTSIEAMAVQEIMPRSRVLTRSEATETALKEVHGPRILHMATHGFFLPDKTGGSARRSGDESAGLGGEDAARPMPIENPLLRSGLILAGANRRANGEDDGVLTALEASSLDLFGTKLVVLSACETGLGEAIGGDGVYGLRRAFVLAGAETQVMSLWKIDDAATHQLMKAYYERLQAGGGRGDALREVQLELLASERSHPYYWASFFVIGDDGPLDGGMSISARTVGRGPRGCACDQSGTPHDIKMSMAIASGLVAALAALRRRRM
jgi:CHAT domain-containing protein